MYYVRFLCFCILVFSSVGACSASGYGDYIYTNGVGIKKENSRGGDKYVINNKSLFSTGDYINYDGDIVYINIGASNQCKYYVQDVIGFSYPRYYADLVDLYKQNQINLDVYFKSEFKIKESDFKKSLVVVPAFKQQFCLKNLTIDDLIIGDGFIVASINRGFYLFKQKKAEYEKSRGDIFKLPFSQKSLDGLVLGQYYNIPSVVLSAENYAASPFGDGWYFQLPDLNGVHVFVYKWQDLDAREKNPDLVWLATEKDKKVGWVQLGKNFFIKEGYEDVVSIKNDDRSIHYQIKNNGVIIQK